MIITCPHCQTKYQVTYEAIGSAGRKVQCAHCQQAWQQAPLLHEVAPLEDVAAFEAMAEDGLDEAMEAEEEAVAAEVAKRLEQEKARHSDAAGKVDPAVIRRRQKDFFRRQNAVNADLPLARARRAARIVTFCALVAVAAVAYLGRVQIVERYPAMAGAYEAIGLKVNVVGLEFSDVTTLRTLRNGKEVLLVSAQIVGTTNDPVPVPPVVVTLLGEHGEGIYEWSVAPAARDLMAGERTTFDTQLATPPGDAARVRLSFSGRSAANTTAPANATGQHQAEPAPAAAHPPAADEVAAHSTTTEHH